MAFVPYLAFIALWSVLVYAVLAHWAFGGGWLQSQGTLDFAGGVPVEMGSGLLGAGGRPRRGRAHGLRAPGAAPAQLGVRPARRGPAVVRLVRLQRRQRLLDRQPGRPGLHQHAPDAGLRAAGLVRRSTTCAAGTSRPSARRRRSSSAASASRRPPGFVSPMSAMLLGLVAAVPSYAVIVVAPADARWTRRSTCSRPTASRGSPASSSSGSSRSAPGTASTTACSSATSPSSASRRWRCS